MASIRVEIAGIHFKNPVMNAAGPIGRDGNALKKIAENGAGGLVAKTISNLPAKVPRPCLALIDKGAGRGRGLLNVETWSDIPYQQWIEKEYKTALETALPLIASIGYTSSQVKQIAKLVEKCGVSAIEFSTHYLGVDTKPLIEVTKTLKEEVDIPIFAKLSPHTSDMSVVAEAVEKAGVDGIVAINSFGPCMHIDINTGKPLLGGKNGYGWISGSCLRPLAVRCVSEVARSVKIPVIGVGGIMTGADAIEHIMAGATAVQICTGAMIEGPEIFGRVVSEIADFMKSNGYDSIEDMRGIALKNLPKEALRVVSVPPQIDRKSCIACGQCVKLCPYGALTMVKDSGQKNTAIIDKNMCYGCGMCVSVCPANAIAFKAN